jgi:hypothetical protein
MSDKAKLISQGFSALRKGNYNVYIYKYDLGKAFTMAKIKAFLLTKVAKIPDYARRTFMINIKFQGLHSNSGWMLTTWLTYEKIKKLELAYQFLTDSEVNVVYKKARYVEILVQDVMKTAQQQIMGTDDAKNDCLFNAIFQAYNFDRDLMPHGIKTAASFKKTLGINRMDKVPFSVLPQLEIILKASFTITGDDEYQSKQIKPYNICLKSKKSHVTLKNNTSKILIKVPYKPIAKDCIFTLCFDDGVIYLYDGTTRIIDVDDYNEIKNDRKKYMLLISKSVSEMEKDRNDFFHKADRLYDATDGFINYYTCKYDSSIAYDIFKKRSLTATEPAQLDAIEQQILNASFRGGLHYAEKGEFKNCTDYDINSMYPYYMTQLGCMMPTTTPEYKMYSQEEFAAMQHPRFGLYKVQFENVHKFWPKGKKSDWYTHYDLNIAKLLGMTYTIVEDETNALLYHPKDCLRGNKVFKTFMEYFDKLGQQDEEIRKMVKPIRNSLWGFFARKNVNYKLLKKGDTFDYSDHFIESMVNETNGSTRLETVEKTNIFKYGYARFSVFLTGYCRYQMILILLKCKNMDDIVCINTDGFISKSTQAHLPLSDKMGDFKIKQSGDCTVKNSCDVKFY